jgi:hypothetical protein
LTWSEWKWGQEHAADPAERHPDLAEPDGAAAPGVEQQVQPARLHQRRGAEARGIEARAPGAEQRHRHRPVRRGLLRAPGRRHGQRGAKPG